MPRHEGRLPRRRVLATVVTLAVIIGLASHGGATLIPGSKNGRNDCLIEADVDAVVGTGPRITCTDGDRCDHDASCTNRSCRLRLRACINETNVARCTGAPIKKGSAIVKVGKRKTTLPLPADLSSPGCGAFVDVDVPVSGKKKPNPGARAILKAKAKKVDSDRVLLTCAPRQGACPSGIADPITPDHPLWPVLKGEVVIDGSLNDPDWSRAVPIVRTQAWRGDGTATIRMLYSSQGLYLSAQVADRNLWADGMGGGSGSYWEVESDDSVTFYFDPDDSREEYFQPTDRAFGVNLGNPTDPVNGGGRVRRCKFVRGDGALGAPDVVSCGDPVDAFLTTTGIKWATTVDGSVNASTDTDSGWVTEIFLPWSALNMSPPSHGQTIGMNFDVIFDNDGGARNFVNNRGGPARFTLPPFVDDHIQGAFSSFHDSLSGLRGPVSYAEAMFVDPSATARPAAIRDLSVVGASAHGARLLFTAPAGTTGGSGHVSSYDIRTSTSPITDEASWTSATPFAQRYTPRLAGLPETLRIAGLSPSTTYYVAVRARDAAGHLGDLSNGATVGTSAPRGPTDRGRVIPAPNGDRLVFEDGTPFVPVGEHLGIGWGWFRNLFPGDVWDPANQVFRNYYTTPGIEGPIGPHLDQLAARGVNTLRVFLEMLNLDETGNPEKPRGRYWIEFLAGTFNPSMRQLVLNALAEAATRDIYLIFSPFDTFDWKGAFTQETPWYTGNGGPLSDLDDFFQNGQTMDMTRRRLRQVMDWVAESPFADHLLGWEPLNEWDAWAWTLNAEGNGEPGRETEMRRRAVWLHALNDYVRQLDPDRLVFSSTAGLDPRGPIGRAVFYDRSFDVLVPHFYTNSSEEPINNPATDKKVLPGVECAELTAYWLTHRRDHRPLLNGEWGMTSADWPGGVPFYGPGFTQQQDEALYRVVSWSGLAAGQLGQGLRIANGELSFNFNALTPAMGDVESALSTVATRSVLAPTLADFAPATLVGRIAATSAAGAALLAWGVSDGAHGLAYVLQDGNKTSGMVTDARLVIEGLDPGVTFTVESWAPAGTASTPIASLSATAPGGVLGVSLPPFAEDVVVVFAR